MLSRRQNSYLGLSVIFVFLIGLAYWVSRQTDWQLRYNKVAQQLSDRDLFTSMIAHEFRSPLTVINGYSSFLTESKELSAEDSRHVQIIKASTAKLLALVNDFLEVARIQSGKLSVEKQSIDVRTILADIVDSLTPMAREKNLQLTSDLPSTPLFVQTDSKRLTQIVHNIVTNAIKYTLKGSVTIGLVDTPRNYTIIIKDTGMGISATDQQKLFAPFSRVGGVEDTTITGTGLGMWITKQLVELLHGTVTAESIKGVGTHVVIVFKH
jgi:signal transduction histidine kinase